MGGNKSDLKTLLWESNRKLRLTNVSCSTQAPLSTQSNCFRGGCSQVTMSYNWPLKIFRFINKKWGIDHGKWVWLHLPHWNIYFWTFYKCRVLWKQNGYCKCNRSLKKNKWISWYFKRVMMKMTNILAVIQNIFLKKNVHRPCCFLRRGCLWSGWMWQRTASDSKKPRRQALYRLW